MASNFLSAAETIAEAFEAETGHTVSLSHGSTGLIFAQIGSGAPFDIFLAADTERPERLVAEGFASESAPYAIGALALVSRQAVDREKVQEAFVGHTVALADPIVAPYGKAATSAMERLKLDTATFRPVLVANVGQVATVFATKNADLAFVAASQVDLLAPEHALDLEGIAPPILQGAALVDGDNPAARAFWDWLFSDAGRALIVAAGYELP